MKIGALIFFSCRFGFLVNCVKKVSSLLHVLLWMIGFFGCGA